MGKALYIGVGNKARKVKKVYVGVGNKARKVKKMYMGIDGKARCIFSGGELSYYGRTATPITMTSSKYAAASVGNYAIFGGLGKFVNDRNQSVHAYNSSLVMVNPSDEMMARSDLKATTVGNYALFGSGYYQVNEVAAYDSSLVKSLAEGGSGAYTQYAATTVGNYALFGGGNTGSWQTPASTSVKAFNSSLVASFPSSLSIGMEGLAATSVGNYALFGGGDTNNPNSSSGVTFNKVVNAYNQSLVRTLPPELSKARDYLAATSVGNYAIFGGGYTVDSNFSGVDIVDAYDASLTRLTLTPLSVGRYYLAATTLGEYALFGGGNLNMSTSSEDYYNYSKVVDVYDASLTKLESKELSYPREDLAATTVGNYALFGGGRTKSSSSGEVDVFQVA